MSMPGRKYEPQNDYRYGFNNKENDKAISIGIQDYGLRVYNSQLGKFLSGDPLTHYYPWYSPYQFAGNTPIQAIDLDGGEPKGYKWSNPYVLSHPGSGVKQIASRYDNQAFFLAINGGIRSLFHVYAIQDIDQKTYLIYQSATGTKDELWYQEYDKNGYKGDPNKFIWNKVPDASTALRWITVAPLLALPGICTGGFLLPAVGGGANSGVILRIQFEAYKLLIKYGPSLGALGRTVAEFLDESGSVGLQNAALRKIAIAATKNAERMTVMLGRYVEGSASSYEKRAGEMFTYFELDNYEKIREIVGSEKMWDINRQFLDDAISKGKKFIFSHNPNEAVGGAFQKEVDYLKSKGYTNFRQLNDNTWEVFKE